MIRPSTRIDHTQPNVAAVRRGLTLVELLIVLAILSVLTSIALPVTRDLIQESRITGSVRNVRVFLESARSRAMASGREHGVEFVRAGTPGEDPNEAGRSSELKLVVGMPSYRGDVEGTRCLVYHETTATAAVFDSTGDISAKALPAAPLVNYANTAIFNIVECPTLQQSLAALSTGATNVQISIRPDDYLIFDGVRGRIVGFSTCDGSEVPFTSGPATVPGNYVKIYFDPRSDTIEPSVVGTMPTVFSVPEPPPLPVGGFWNRTFEIERSQLRPTASTLQLQRGAAVDLYFSGSGAAGTEFSPVSITGAATLADLTTFPDLASVVVVFSPSGEVSRVLLGRLQGGTITLVSRVPKSSLHFLVGRTDEIRSDLIYAAPTLPVADDNNLSNLIDTRSRWVSVNVSNGRISNTPVRSPRPGAASIPDQILNARVPALQAREQL